MRIGLVIYGSLDIVSGGYLYDRRLVDVLRDHGDQVEIISLPWRSYPRHLTDNWSSALARRMLDGFDILLQDELNHPSLAWLNGRIGANRPPIVSLVHHLRSSEVHPLWLMPLYRVVERRYLRSVDAFIYNSHTTRREVETLLGHSRPHVVAYPAGDRLMMPGLVSEPGRVTGNHPLRLIFTGNLIPRKGLHVLLAALARVRCEWRLDIIGDPAIASRYVHRVRRIAQRSNLDERIIWHGKVSDAQLATHLAAADVLAVPSQYEGFGIVYLEGMGYGLPVLATTAGAAPELIADGINGFLVAPGDTNALAERIALLAGDPTVLARMSQAALARYAVHPTWAETMAAAREFLVKIAAGGN